MHLLHTIVWLYFLESCLGLGYSYSTPLPLPYGFDTCNDGEIGLREAIVTAKLQMSNDLCNDRDGRTVKSSLSTSLSSECACSEQVEIGKYTVSYLRFHEL